jgi:hypothetical protein
MAMPVLPSSNRRSRRRAALDELCLHVGHGRFLIYHLDALAVEDGVPQLCGARRSRRSSDREPRRLRHFDRRRRWGAVDKRRRFSNSISACGWVRSGLDSHAAAEPVASDTAVLLGNGLGRLEFAVLRL